MGVHIRAVSFAQCGALHPDDAVRSAHRIAPDRACLLSGQTRLNSLDAYESVVVGERRHRRHVLDPLLLVDVTEYR